MNSQNNFYQHAQPSANADRMDLGSWQQPGQSDNKSVYSGAPQSYFGQTQQSRQSLNAGPTYNSAYSNSDYSNNYSTLSSNVGLSQGMAMTDYYNYNYNESESMGMGSSQNQNDGFRGININSNLHSLNNPATGNGSGNVSKMYQNDDTSKSKGYGGSNYSQSNPCMPTTTKDFGTGRTQFMSGYDSNSSSSYLSPGQGYNYNYNTNTSNTDSDYGTMMSSRNGNGSGNNYNNNADIRGGASYSNDIGKGIDNASNGMEMFDSDKMRSVNPQYRKRDNSNSHDESFNKHSDWSQSTRVRPNDFNSSDNDMKLSTSWRGRSFNRGHFHNFGNSYNNRKPEQFNSNEQNFTITLNATNYNQWRFLRKVFNKRDDDLAEHLLEIHEESCHKCPKRIEEKRRIMKIKNKDDNQVKDIEDNTEEEAPEEKLSEEELQMRNLMGFSGFKSTRLSTDNDSSYKVMASVNQSNKEVKEKECKCKTISSKESEVQKLQFGAPAVTMNPSCTYLASTSPSSQKRAKTDHSSI